MPGPLSRNRMTAVSVSALRVMEIVPPCPSIASAALRIRFRKVCSSLSRSRRKGGMGLSLKNSTAIRFFAREGRSCSVKDFRIRYRFASSRFSFQALLYWERLARS